MVENISFSEMSKALVQLSLDQVQRAKSGHPGMPMGFADVATVLWSKFLRFDPSQPTWFNRDRFILSNGHGSALHYALLHLTGYPLTLDDCKAFRQVNSKTPGHPEIDPRIGIETTTGPLGQGLAAGCGIAVAQKHLNASLDNKLTFKTYVVVGDGCLMEGISHEVANCASIWELSNLVVLWDDNDITIDGAVSMTSKERTCDRFRSYGWHVIGPVDGHDFSAIEIALSAAQQVKEKPVFIDFRTVIGKGCDAEGTSQVHGAPLPQKSYERILAGRAPFSIDPDALKAWRSLGMQAEPKFFSGLSQEQQSLYQQCLKRDKPKDWFARVEDWMSSDQAVTPMATRQASQQVLKQLAPYFPQLIGGSADLTGSVCTQWGCADFSASQPEGRYLNFGVREFAMFAIASGMATMGLRPYVGTFLTFCDYGRNAIRCAALMDLPVVYILTHDSIALGEDGPTHQPIEHLAILRATPNLEVWRPANGLECARAWQAACERKGPTAIVLTRQENAAIPRPIQGELQEGASVIFDHPKASFCLLATGSEVAMAFQASQILAQSGIYVRVVSCPCLQRFKNSTVYEAFIGGLPIVVIEAASSQSWGDIQPNPQYRITMESYGLSGRGQDVQDYFGFTPEKIAKRVKSLLTNQEVKYETGH